MQIAQMILDFLQAAFWPLIALIVLWGFRSEFSGLIERIKHAAWGSASVDIGDANRTLLDANQAVENLAVPPDGAIVQEAPDSSSNATHAEASVQMSRADLQELVQKFARAGWATGSDGIYAEPPRPEIEWSADGSPHIARWVGKTRDTHRRGLISSTERDAERLESQIQNLETSLLGVPLAARYFNPKIGRASCRDRVSRLV